MLYAGLCVVYTPHTFIRRGILAGRSENKTVDHFIIVVVPRAGHFLNGMLCGQRIVEVVAGKLACALLYSRVNKI